MTDPQPLTDQQYDEYETAVAAYQQHAPTGFACCSAHPAADAAAALLADNRRLRAQVAVFTTLAERWEQMADHGDQAIGHFEGSAAATLDAEVGERGRTYRKAASDIRDVLATGRIPHDLMTDAELAAASPAV